MIDFEDAQAPRERASVRERIEARTEDHELADAVFDRVCGSVLGKSRADRDEDPHSAGVGPFGRSPKELLSVFAENAARERVGKDLSALEDLMRRAVRGGGECCTARLAGSHVGRLTDGANSLLLGPQRHRGINTRRPPGR